MAIALRSKRWPRGRRVASMSQSGGNVVQMADVGASLDLEWSEYSDSTQQRIAERIPGYGKVGNPTDMTSMVTGQMALYRQALEIITEDDNVDVMVPVFTMANRGELDHAVELAKASAKPVVILWTGGCLDQPDLLVDDLVRAGAPAFRDTLMCLQAVHAAIGYRAFLDRRARRGTPERPSNMDASAARALIAAAPGGTLTERLSKQVLAVYGVPVTGEKLARNADEAVTHARALGLPVALKVESADIAHKTEAGAIRLGLRDDAQIRQAFDDIVAAAQRYKPGAHIDGVLVQQMAAAGTEMIVGIADDPVFGPVIAAGLGGIHVEVLRDVAYRIPPIDAEEALSMLHELRAFRLLEGVRGQAPRDLGALSQAIERISWLAHELRDVVAELDVNPLMAFERGVLAVDALLIKKELP
jgi:acetyltransferase